MGETLRITDLRDPVLTEAQLKLLNGRYGGEALPKPGERVKTVVAAP